MPFLETGGEIPMNARTKHFINMPVVAYIYIYRCLKLIWALFYKMDSSEKKTRNTSHLQIRAFYKYKKGRE